MDNYVDHAKNTIQSSSGRACNYYPTKSCENINTFKSSDKQSTFNSHSTYTADTTHHESATWFAIDSRKEAFRTVPTEQGNLKKLRNLQKRHTLPAKVVFLKWWLDTLGHSTPLRSAWEDDEESIFRSTTSSRTCSPTYLSGRGVNFRQSTNSGAYKFVSKRDPDVHNSGRRRPIDSVTGVSRIIYPFPKSHKRQKTKNRSLGSNLNSSLSLNESVNQTVSVRQEFLDKEAKLCGQKCPELGQHQERQREVNDVHSWLSITSSATRHMHDRNTSSNVIVLAQLSSQKASKIGLLNNKGIVKNGQEDNTKKNTLLSRVQEVKGQQTSKSDIGMANEVKSQQNIENNLILLTNNSRDSQADDKLFSLTVSGRDIRETVTSPADEPTSVAISISHPQNNMQTQIISDNYLLACGTAVSKGPTREGQYEKPQQSLLLHRDIEEATVTAYGDQNYNSPIIRTESDSSNNGHCSLSLAKEADKSPPKVSMDDDCCLSGNDISNRTMFSPNFYVHFGKRIPAEHEKHRHLLSGHTNIVNNDPGLVHEENICRRHRGSYFSRLVERRIRVNESQHMDSHEEVPISHKLSLNVQANTDGQFAPVPTIFESSNQSNEQSPLPLAVSKPGLDSKYLVLHKHVLSDDPEMKRIQVSSDGSKSLDQHSEMFPSDDDRSSINNNTNRVNKTVTRTDQARCSSPDVPFEQPNDCSTSFSEDPHMNSFTGATIRNQNNAKFESEDDNSSSDNNEQNSLSSYAYSSLPSGSAASRNSSSDVEVSISEYLKCSSASWSTTSLPPKLFLEPKVSQIKYAASSTNIEEIRRNQIIQTARLLILMLDKLPMEDHVWCNNYLHENKRRHSELSFKHGHGYQRRPLARSVSFHSYILSLLKKLYSFNKIKPTLKMDNEESVQEQTFATNESTQNSKLAMCMDTNLVPKHKSMNDKMKVDANNVHETPSFDNSSRKPQFQYATYGFTKYASKTNERDCIKRRRKRKKNFGHLYQMFPRRKYTCGSKKVLNDTSYSSSTSNMLYQSDGSEHQQAFQKVMSSQPNVETSDQMQEKHKQKKYQADLNNCENITSESDISYGAIRVSKRMSREQSGDLSDVNALRAKPDQRENNMSVEVAFHSQSGLSVCHKPHPPDTSLKTSEVKMSSPPYLDTRVPVYPKPKPCALGGIPDQEALKPKEAFNLPNPTTTQLSLASLKRSISSKLPWTKLPLQKKLQASDINDNPLRIATVENTETRSHMKSNKETCGTNTHKHVLPPLLCSTSENVDINSDKCMNNSKILKFGMLLAQHKTYARKEDNSQAKQDLSSLVHLDSLPKCYCDSKSASLENSRICNKITLASLQNHGSTLSPLRQRFYHVTSKVSNSAPKTLHSPSWRIPYAPYHLCGGRGAAGNDRDKTTIASPDVSIVNAETNDLQSLTIEAESEEVDSGKSCEMHNVNRFVNKNGIKSDRSEISSVLCENSLAVQNAHTNKGSCSNNLPDTIVCKESKINNPGQDEKSSCTRQENNNPDTTFKTQNTLESKDNCSCRSKFKFLTLLLSDELDKSQI